MGAACCSSDGCPVERGEASGVGHFGRADGPVRLAVGGQAGGFPPDSVVRIAFLGAQDLDSRRWSDGQGPREPYCVCEIEGKASSRVATPPSRGGTRSPTWNFEALMPSYVFPDALVFTVLDADCGGPGDAANLGFARVSPHKLQAGNGTFEGPLPLAGVKGVVSIPMLTVRIEAVPCTSEDGGRGPHREPACAEEPSMADPAAAFAGRASDSPHEGPVGRSRGRLLHLAVHKKEGQPLGMLLWGSDEEVIIAEILSGGAAEDYNRGAREQEKLRAGDIVVEANGLQSVDAIVAKLGTADDLELLVELGAYVLKPAVEEPHCPSRGCGWPDDPMVLDSTPEGLVEDLSKSDREEVEVPPGSTPSSRWREGLEVPDEALGGVAERRPAPASS